MTQSIEERVNAGADWLDENGPDNWWDVIDLDRLYMEDTCSCVLGQLFSPENGFNYTGVPHPVDPDMFIIDGFTFATDRFRMSLEKQIALGFEAAAVNGGYGEPYSEYNALALAWNTLVIQRREN